MKRSLLLSDWSSESEYQFQEIEKQAGSNLSDQNDYMILRCAGIIIKIGYATLNVPVVLKHTYSEVMPGDLTAVLRVRPLYALIIITPLIFQLVVWLSMATPSPCSFQLFQRRLELIVILST